MTDVTVPDSHLGKYYCRLQLMEYTRPKPLNPSKTESKAVIYLPLPQELRDDTSVMYNQTSLETIGDILNDSANKAQAAVLRNAGDLAAGAGSVLTNTLQNFGNARGGWGRMMGAAAGGVGSIAGKLMPPNQITSAVQQENGVAPNPNPSVEFQGPQLRDIQLSWSFYPQNTVESKNIQKVINRLKAAALPQMAGAESSAVLRYPMLCQVNMYPWDKGGSDTWNWSERSIFKLKRSFLSSVNVSYNAYGTPSFFHGTNLPTSYQLSIGFKEAEYMLSDDWESGFQEQKGVSTIGALAKTAGTLAGNILGVGQTAVSEWAAAEVPQSLTDAAASAETAAESSGQVPPQ